MQVLGIMSGTSIDSVDYALCDIAAGKVRLLRHWQVPFSRALKHRLHAAARGECSSHELAQLHHDLGRFYARHAEGKPQLVGVHGQTIYHNPSKSNAATLQIGEPAWLTGRLRIPVISNFRAADLAAGGQGAPLATMFHLHAFGDQGRHVCVNNLGGISNVTSIDWRRGKQPKVMAFDTGPANVLIDIAVRHFTKGKSHFDRNGAWARRGKVQQTLVEEWLAHPYFARKPPKSTGRELFGESFWNREFPRMQKAGLGKFDVVATLTAFTVRSIALNYERHLSAAPDRMILTGGGAANAALVAAIKKELSVQTITSAEIAWPLQSIEAAAFALLAWLRFMGKPGNLPETTGAKRPVLLGQITG